MSTAVSTESHGSTWQPQKPAWDWLRHVVDSFIQQCREADALSQAMASRTGTRFIDWIDHVVLPQDSTDAAELERVGYLPDPQHSCVHRHSGGVFPLVAIGDTSRFTLALKIEDAQAFQSANKLDAPIAGEPGDLVRQATVGETDDCTLLAIERHGCSDLDLPPKRYPIAATRLRHAEQFRKRRRKFAHDEAGFDDIRSLIRRAIDDGLTRPVVCDLFFAAERDYWMSRNRAARVQYARQQALGLGWANHDHHTYRSSRTTFSSLIALWEMLGLQCRESFYAGAEAGWGAQVMEHPVCGIVTFNDVDLSPEELSGDFAHTPLPPRDKLGTVGLWCGLHGESILQAGMHHLECQFDFESLRKQLASNDVDTMPAFTDLPYLKQAFTVGERWPVEESRLVVLEISGLITPEQAGRFRQEGAVGSHLENLERNDGFKGFNQKGVSDIIGRTDPRKA